MTFNSKSDKLFNYGKIIKKVNLFRSSMNMSIREACENCNITDAQYYNMLKYYENNKDNITDIVNFNVKSTQRGGSSKKIKSKDINVILTAENCNKNNTEENSISDIFSSNEKKEHRKKMLQRLRE